MNLIDNYRRDEAARKAKVAKHRASAAQPVRLERTDDGPRCPHCGGAQFKVRRRTSTKVLAGAFCLLGQAKHVRCVTCGREYDRG